jgi:hypothetical protein
MSVAIDPRTHRRSIPPVPDWPTERAPRAVLDALKAATVAHEALAAARQELEQAEAALSSFDRVEAEHRAARHTGQDAPAPEGDRAALATEQRHTADVVEILEERAAEAVARVHASADECSEAWKASAQEALAKQRERLGRLLDKVGDQLEAVTRAASEVSTASSERQRRRRSPRAVPFTDLHEEGQPVSGERALSGLRALASGYEPPPPALAMRLDQPIGR